MIERTKARLAEARSLLAKLQKEQFRQVQQANPTASSEFFSLLSNFITAARSVRWVLQREEKAKYDALGRDRGMPHFRKTKQRYFAV
jgi:hypothetical protein